MAPASVSGLLLHPGPKALLEWSAGVIAFLSFSFAGGLLLTTFSLRKQRQTGALMPMAEQWAAAAVAGEPAPASRRVFGAAGLGWLAGAAALTGGAAPAGAFPPPDTVDPIPKERYVKLPSGVIYADAQTGTGEEVKEGDRVSLQWCGPSVPPVRRPRATRLCRGRARSTPIRALYHCTPPLQDLGHRISINTFNFGRDNHPTITVNLTYDGL